MAEINYENLDCSYSIRLINKLKSLDTKNILDFELVNKAIYWARKYHGDQKRKSGEPYYSHPLEVAYMISEYKLKTDVIVTSILHDIVEDTEVTVEMIQGTFGDRIAEMVNRLTRDRPDGTKLSVEEILNNTYRLKDKEVLLIKLFDRLHNIRTLDYMSEVKIECTLSETIYQFVIPAVYYGYYEIEKELWRIYCHYKSLNYMSLSFVDGQFNNKPLVALSQAYKNVEFPK